MQAAQMRSSQSETLGCVQANAAGLDIGAEFIVAAVTAERDPQPVRSFTTFTADVHALVDWLITCGITTVAMEATGVYWIPIYELLEQRGITPYLVNAQHVKMVPGRKSDWNDAQWLQKLHALGLLARSFRPDHAICALRALVRYRNELLQHRTPHMLPMQPALKVMNLQLSEVVTDSTGTTGLTIMRAIVAGERDPVLLAQHRAANCTSSSEKIAQALTGTWQEEQRFILAQALALCDDYTAKVEACDRRLAAYLQPMESRGSVDAPLPDLPPAKAKSRARNQLTFNARAQLARIVGVDLVAVTGLAAATVLTIISEIGTDMSRFPSSKHVCAWLGLVPRNDISGGKVIRSRTMKVANRAAQAFRQAAQSVSRSDSAFGAFFRALRARKGPQQAIVATAHTLARTVYALLKNQTPFEPERAEAYAERRRERERRQLERRAARLGFTLTPTAPDTLAAVPR